MSAHLIVRVRGRAHIKAGIADAMKVVGLTRKNHCVVLADTPQNIGMIKKAKDYITWGPADEKTVTALLKNRGKVTGGKALTDEYVKKNSKHENIGEFAKKLAQGDAQVKDVKGLKKAFKLNPPRKGFERGGIKKPYSVGGALGNRREKIGDLVMRMI